LHSGHIQPGRKQLRPKRKENDVFIALEAKVKLSASNFRCTTKECSGIIRGIDRAITPRLQKDAIVGTFYAVVCISNG